MSPKKGAMKLGKKGNIRPWCIGPFEVINFVGPSAYIFSLPPNLSRVHPVFHVSMLKKYHGNGDYITK